MTRINAGIQPWELSDQHLISEYKELPRMVALAWRHPSQAGRPFTLNTGHMLSMVRIGAYLADRHAALIAEMRIRRFDPQHPAVRVEQFPATCRERPSDDWLAAAREIVKARIVERLTTMKRPPRWTSRRVPDWAAAVLTRPPL